MLHKRLGIEFQEIGGPIAPSYTVFILEPITDKELGCSWPDLCFLVLHFWPLCVLILFDCRQYLETRSLNQRLDSRERHTRDPSLGMACEEDDREGTSKDRDLDWHHYSKSSGRSGRSGRSRRSSRRHRDRRHRRSHSHHRSPSVREPPSTLYPPSPVYTAKSNGSLSLVLSQCLTPVSLTLYLSVCSTCHYYAWFPVMGRGLEGSGSKGLSVFFVDFQERSGPSICAEILLGSYVTWW